MAVNITLPAEYGYVLAAATSTYFVNFYHMILTSKARKASGIKYPAAYAANEVAEKDPKAFAFNCTQRAHANFTENLTPFVVSLLVAGLRFPVAAATMGAGWSALRALYAYGYACKGPQGRTIGSITSRLLDIGLVGMAMFTSYKFIQAL
ncbi:Membrane-associated proteins in eicosanoid and glutathione metabolism [Coniochaeta hoffmannii]|uniref:Membrane-associated proteins in eicosanoid and glutathione metabolism n=1 Tax=Coniochaeta hoffmannii TaxID=91930 RepID=A0AA38R954_9PEZI|nr:Membrane-associated proteins in eicosanoid and glutathione metabolism [Coniochaeta hoffmannii]